MQRGCRKELKQMNKTIDERLFEQLMRAPHQIRRAIMRNRMNENMPMHGHCHGKHRGFHPEMRDMRGPHGPHFMHEHIRKGERNPAFAREHLLRFLADQTEGVRQKVIADQMHINASSVSELISKLESEGYVKRTTDPDDKRATRIVLTDLGEARAAELQDERAERFAGIFDALTQEEKEQLLALLEKLTETGAEHSEAED